ncbi:MAG: thioredoxin [Erythrobacter sp.]
MESIAARALGKGTSDRARPPRVPDERVSGEEAAPEAPANAPDEAVPDDNEAFTEPFSSDTDPLAGEDGPLGADDYDHGDTPFDSDYDDGFRDDDYEGDGVSQFEYRAPFTARRNPAKMWTAAAAIFAMMAAGTVLAVNYYGLPGWLPINQPTFGIGKPDLVLDFPSADQGEEVLNEGQTIFRVRGSINNVGRETQTIPNLVVVFEDGQDVEVFRKTITPTKSELAPGETLKVTEAISDYPENAVGAGIGWSPN